MKDNFLMTSGFALIWVIFTIIAYLDTGNAFNIAWSIDEFKIMFSMAVIYILACLIMLVCWMIERQHNGKNS